MRCAINALLGHNSRCEHTSRIELILLRHFNPRKDMHFNFVDKVIEREPGRIVTIKAVTRSEEYLQDHFATFPVLPGVFMLESLVQAGRELLRYEDKRCARHVLGEAKAIRYASFVRPGETLRLTVSIQKEASEEGGEYQLKGEATTERDGETEICCSGRFTLRPVKLD
ncbi:MAG: beta-hydroxyacyl-ACP dehydratase [Planctomycetota bacterium]